MPGNYTWGERWRLARLEAKAARQVFAAGDENAGGDDRAQDRIHGRAEDRYDRNANAAMSQLRTADHALARAEAAFRVAKGPDKTTARRARNDARDNQRRADRAARKYS